MIQIHQKLKTRESCLEGKDGFEIDRNEEPQNLRSRRSQSSALNPESYTEFPEQMIIICENEQLRNELLQLINQRILEIRNIIDQMEMPSGVHRIHCDCFDVEDFDELKEEEPNDEEVGETNE